MRPLPCHLPDHLCKVSSCSRKRLGRLRPSDFFEGTWIRRTSQTGQITAAVQSGPAGQISASFRGAVLADSNGELWAVALEDRGMLHATSTTTGISGTYINWWGNMTSWLMSVTTSGNLTETAVPSSRESQRIAIFHQPIETRRTTLVDFNRQLQGFAF